MGGEVNEDRSEAEAGDRMVGVGRGRGEVIEEGSEAGAADRMVGVG